MVSQPLNARYVDKHKLARLLKELFPNGGFEWEEDDDGLEATVTLYVPRRLSELATMRENNPHDLTKAQLQAPLTNAECERIFHSTKIRAEKVWLSRSSRSLWTTSMRNTQELENSLVNTSDETFSVFILRQSDSWSQIELPLPAFSALTKALDIFSPFWNIINNFGLKFESQGENFVDIYSKFSYNPKQPAAFARFEVSYTIRYFALHGRPGTRTIWSERQMAVYHSFECASSKSNWILIQPSEVVESKLTRYLDYIDQRDPSWDDQVVIHITLLSTLATKWRPYINFLEDRLNEMDEKALHSRLSGVRKPEHPVTFRDLQTSERLRRKILKAYLILDSNLEVAESLCTDLKTCSGGAASMEALNALGEIQQYSTNLKRCLRVVNSLLDRLTGTSKLLFHILEYRYDEASIEANIAIKDNGEQIKKLTEMTMIESDRVTQLTKEIHQDSKVVKILTFVALLYAPAALVATIFSSNLVQVKESQDDQGHSYMVLVSDFWKYPLVTAGLVVLTLLLSFGWRNYSRLLIKLIRSAIP